MRYFAYGSNLHPTRISARIPDKKLEGVGVLKGYALRFNKVGRDGSAKCNIARTDNPAACVIGVIYRLTETAKQALDRIEGLGRDYDHLQVTIATGNASCRAYTYVASPGATDERLHPFDWYRAYVLAGARRHDFPLPYVRALAAVKCIADPDTARAAENYRILRANADVGALIG